MLYNRYCTILGIWVTVRSNSMCRILLQDVCCSLLGGFNQTLVSMGQTQLGKSASLFGKFAWPASRMRGPCCILTAVLRRLLSRANSEQGQIQIALSCWEVSCDQVSVIFSF